MTPTPHTLDLDSRRRTPVSERDRRRAGFTLIEIMIVVVIIGLLGALVANQMFARVGDAQIQLAGQQLEIIGNALELYKLDNGRYPTSDQGLEALVRKPDTEPQPRRYPPRGYLDAKQLVDPWGMPYQYQQPGDHNRSSYDLTSYGPDGVQGGEGESADIVNWDTGAS